MHEIAGSSTRNRVFVSYSHRDRAWLDRLNVHLRPLVRDGVIVTWDDTQLEPGSPWRTEIETALAAARVAVLLVSADFLASDFVADTELPRLLSAAEADGAVILPVILSPSRFSRTPLAQFQAVNDPARPLISVGVAEQEEVLVRVSEAVERAMTPEKPAQAPPREEPAEREPVPLIAKFPFADCLVRLGADPQLLETEELLVREWLRHRMSEGRWTSATKDLRLLLSESGEPSGTIAPVAHFFEELLACCAPEHQRVGGTYLSRKKVNEAWRLLQRELGSVPPPESPAEKLRAIHEVLLKADRIVFLPERVLLGRDLPESDHQLCYFSGTFVLDVDFGELAKVPGASELVDAKGASLYSVVSSVFQNPDPFVYPLLSFTGTFGEEPVSMVLSRKYIQFGSGTATSLTEALTRRNLQVSGIGVLRRAAEGRVLHPLSCSF